MTAPVAHPDKTTITHAAEILRAGGLVAIPTETVYGLACDASNSQAVARLYAAKGRPEFNPLIAHVIDIASAANEGIFNAAATTLATKAWPGPLTLVLPLANTHSVCELARAGRSTIALRAPAHPVARALLQEFGGPLAAPSANPSGKISPTEAVHVAADMDEAADLILDGGPCRIGVESTILSCLNERPQLLRPGAFDASEFAAALQDEDAPLAPGALSRHYAPNATLRLNEPVPVRGSAYLGFGPMPAQTDLLTLNLSERGDLAEAAANLFAMLRELDKQAPRIAIAPIPMAGLGLAINDRLARAAKRY